MNKLPEKTYHCFQKIPFFFVKYKIWYECLQTQIFNVFGRD